MRITSRSKVWLVLLSVGMLALAGCSMSENSESPLQAIKDAQMAQQQAMRSTGSTGPGDVQIDLTPHKIENGVLNVDITVNTHSVDLSQYDLKEMTTLEIEGESIRPMSAPNLGGHHVSGTMVFVINKSTIDAQSESFSIIIRGIPKVNERIYDWK